MKNRMGKRIVSLLLSLIMAVGVLPMSALAYTIDANGTEVDLTFGKELDPNTVLDSKYDIKAMGSIQMKADINGTDKLMAEGRVDLLVPYEMFETTIQTKIADAAAAVTTTKMKLFTDGVAEALEVTLSSDDDVPVSGIPGVEKIPVGGLTLAEAIDTIRNGYVEYGGSKYYYNQKINVKTVLKDIADIVAVKVFTTMELPEDQRVSCFEDGDMRRAANNWAADTASSAEAMAKQLITVVVTEGLKSDSTVGSFVGSVETSYIDSVAGKAFLSTAEDLEADIAAAVKSGIENVANEYVISSGILKNIKKRFYGTLYPLDDDTLTSRFATLNDLIDTFLKSLPSQLGDVSFTFSLPTDKISGLENMLKSIVKKLNNTDEDPVIQGAIIGVDPADKLSVCYPTGMYVVAGVDPEKPEGAEDYDMIYKSYVLAPAVVTVALKNGSEDMNYFMRTSVDKTINITATPDVSSYDPNDLTLHYYGVQTDGKTYDSDEAPTEAGVYTVFALYFNENSLAMGGNVAALVVEPQEDKDFDVADATHEAGAQWFADIDNPNGQAVVQVAVDQDAPEVYVKLPSGFGDKAGAVTDKAADIVNRFESTMEKYLPVPDRVTAKILGALDKLEEVADKSEGPAKVTSKDVKERLLTYIDAITAWYSKDKVMDEAAEAVDKVKTELKNNDTVKRYEQMVDSVLANFNFPTPADSGIQTFAARTPQKELVNEFIDRFMTEIKGNKDDIKALLTYIADYADNSSYKQDAVTMIKTLGAVGKVDTSVVDPAVTAVEGAFTTLKNDMTELITSIGLNVPTVADGATALGYVETFVETVMGEAKKVVKAFNISTLYLGTLPSKAGVYDCYAVNVSTDYMPALKKATLTLTAVDDVPTGTITNSKITLSLEGMVYVELLVGIDGFEGIDLTEKGGVVVWTGDTAPASSALLEVGAENCVSFQNMYWSDMYSTWAVSSHGIRAMDYGDTVYMRPYIEVAEGVYVYTEKGKSLSPEAFCKSVIAGSYADDMKEVCAAMLEYGAAAQVYFGDEDPLVNEDVDLSGYNLTFDDSMLDAYDAPPAGKSDTLSGVKDKVGKLEFTLSLDTGAIVMVVLCPNLELADEDIASAELLVWTEADFKAVDDLAYELENYSYSVPLERNLVPGKAHYAAFSDLIPAAKCGDTLYVSARFETKTGEVYRSGLSVSSPDRYIELTKDAASEVHVNLVKALAVYSEKARAVFNYYD